MSETYGWTPDQINQLTLFQAAMYFGAIGPEHGRVKLEPVEAQSYLKHLRSRK